MIAMGIFPIDLTTFMLELTSRKDVIEFEFKVTERRTIHMDKKTNRCKSYEEKGPGFNQCVKDFIGGYIEANMKCLLPGMCKTITS